MTCLEPSLKAMGLRPGELLASKTFPSGRNLPRATRQGGERRLKHNLLARRRPCKCVTHASSAFELILLDTLLVGQEPDSRHDIT